MKMSYQAVLIAFGLSLGLGTGSAQAASIGGSINIPITSRVAPHPFNLEDLNLIPGLRGTFYDRDDPVFAINSLSVADSIVASSRPTTTFTATKIDYPRNEDIGDYASRYREIEFLPTVGTLLGPDAASLAESSVGERDASPSIWRFTGFINIPETIDGFGYDINPSTPTIEVGFGLGSDDGSRLTIGGVKVLENDGIDVFFPVGFQPDTLGNIVTVGFQDYGLYPFEMIWYDHFGGIGIELTSTIPDFSNVPDPNTGMVVVPSSVFFQPDVGYSEYNPILPEIDESGRFTFTDALSGLWFDPPLASGFVYTMASNSLFTEILGFPTGFTKPFKVSVGNTVLGYFGPNDSLDFVHLLGGGVSSFTIADIAPGVIVSDPIAFPLQLAFNTPTASFTMQSVQPTAVPTPTILPGLFGLGLSILRKRWNSQTAKMVE